MPSPRHMGGSPAGGKLLAACAGTPRPRPRFPLVCSPEQMKRNKQMVRKFILAAGIAALSLTATACNTVKGVGEDIESVGEAGDEAIN